MKILLVDNQTKHVEEWRNLLANKGIRLTVIPYSDCDVEYSKQFDLVILSGGSAIAVPHNRIPFSKEIILILNSGIPVLGVCLGFELIADTFGVMLKYREEKVAGFSEIKVTKPHAIFGDKKEFVVREAHKFYVDELTDDLDELARSSSGIEIFKHREKPIWGFQFHPEIVSPENQGTELFLNLIKGLRSPDVRN